MRIAIAVCLAGCAACGETPAAETPQPPAALAVPTSRDAADLIGKPAPDLGGVTWLRGGATALQDLRGKPVVIRWWTANCILCRHSATALVEIEKTYGPKGVKLLAVFHEKPAGRPMSDAQVLDVADAIGMPGTVGWDRRWTKLREWWLNAPTRRFTSVTFLLDASGVIRWIHPGGEFHRPLADADHPQCARDFADLRQALDALLAEAR